MKVRGFSFHSVKGGVGKSSLATVAALQCARADVNRPVYLIDMDLTGTSLADVLQLEAPKWRPDEPVGRSLFESTYPIGFHSVEDSRIRIESRHHAMTNRKHAPPDVFVPFLNDFLLHEPTDEAREQEVLVEALCWKLKSAPSNLRVIPSSAAPGDLDRIVPVIFDEQHAALLEARLEKLIARLLAASPGEITVIVDVPPTIPGLSRSVISLGLRLSRAEKEPLAVKGDVATPLDEADVRWTINFVTSPDPQDLRATERWFGLLKGEERKTFRLVVNRHPWAAGAERKHLADALGLPAADPQADPLTSLSALEPFIEGALFVPIDAEIAFFQKRSLPTKTLEFGKLV